MARKQPVIRLYIDAAGEYRWQLIGRNGRIQIPPEGHTSKSHMLKSIESVRRNLTDAIIVDDTKSKPLGHEL